MKKRFYQLGKQVLSLSAIVASTLLFSNQVSAQGVSINATGTGTAPAASSILDLDVSGLPNNGKKGFLVPRITAAQKALIATPATGLLIYQTDATAGFYYYDGAAWVTFGGGSGPTEGFDTDISSGTNVDIEPDLDYVKQITAPLLQDLTLQTQGSNIIFRTTAGPAELGRFLPNGNFGIGDPNPSALFTVGNGDKFQVDANGDLIRINNVPYTWPAAQGSASQVLSNNGSGTLSWSNAGSLLTAGAGISIVTNTISLANGSAAGQVYVTGASPFTPTLVDMSGDVDINSAGATTIQDNAVDGGDLSLTAETTGDVMRFDGANWVAVDPIATLTEGNDINFSGTNQIDVEPQLDFVHTIVAPAASNLTLTGLGTRDIIFNANNTEKGRFTTNGFQLGVASSANGNLRFLNSSNANTVSIVPGITSTSYTLTLPTAAPSANGQVLSSTTGGALSWATTFTNPMNQFGDIIYSEDASGTPNDLDPGTAGMVLRTNGLGFAPSWNTIDLDNTPLTQVSGTLGVGNGGTGLNTITTNAILLGNGTGNMTQLTGIDMQTIRYNGTAPTANSNLLNNGTTIGIGGLTTTDVTNSDAKLDVYGDQNVGTVALQLRAGNATAGPTNAVQIAFGYNGTETYRHNIRSVHNAGDANNKLAFYVWQPTQLITDMGNKKVIEIDYEKMGFWGRLESQGVLGTNGQILISDASGVPTWQNPSSLGITTSVTAPIVNTGTGTAPVIGIRGTSGGILYGLGAGTSANFSAAGTSGQILLSGGTGAPTWSSVAGLMFDLTASNGLTLTANYDGSSNQDVKLGGALTATTTITQPSTFNMIHNLTGTGDFDVQVGGSTQFIVDAATGNVGIGGSTVSHKLTVTGKVKSTGINETSDVRLKTNFAPIEGALNKVLALNGKYYDWRVSEFPNKGLDTGRQIGVIAQEIEKILPEVVDTDSEGYKSVEYSHIVPVLIEAIKEQQKIIDGQNSTITDLKASLENVLNRVNIIEKNADIISSKVER